MEIDKTSLAWIGYSAMMDHYGVSNEQKETFWISGTDPKAVSGYAAVAEAISKEAIRRYEADKQLLHDAPPKPRYGGFLEATRDLSR